jgi:hypothetical protein
LAFSRLNYYNILGIPFTTGNYFFSGHISLAIIIGSELNYIGYPILSFLLTYPFNLFQICVFLTTRSHYSCDILAAIFCSTMIINTIKNKKPEKSE